MMDFVRVEVEDHIATVTFDRPPVNAVDVAANTELQDAFDAIGEDKDVRVAIFTAAGDRAFIAGADMKAIDRGLERRRLVDVTDTGRGMREAFWSVYDCAVPVIGAINGPAIGAGLAYAAMCDIIIAAEEATFGTTEINVGLLGAASHLQRMVGPYKTRWMFLTGALVPAAELYRLGAIEQVVPRSRLLEAANELAHELAKKSPIAMRLAKEAMNRVEYLPLKEGYRTEQDYTNRLLTFDDSKEAVRAFLEKREPEWGWS